jgi:hypothetical protein
LSATFGSRGRTAAHPPFDGGVERVDDCSKAAMLLSLDDVFPFDYVSLGLKKPL